jgi:hypothetical protein
MCYILQILFVSEMVNNFYQFVFVLFNCEELANDYFIRGPPIPLHNMLSRKNILPVHESRIKKIIDHVSRLSKISPSRKTYIGSLITFHG